MREGCPVVGGLGTHLPEVWHGSRLRSVPKDGGLWAGWLAAWEAERRGGDTCSGKLFSKLELTQFKLKGIVSVPEQAGRKAVIQMHEEGSKLPVQSRGSEACTRGIRAYVSKQVAAKDGLSSLPSRVLNSAGTAQTSHGRGSGERISANVITV